MLEAGRPVLYCSDVSPAFKDELLDRLTSQPAAKLFRDMGSDLNDKSSTRPLAIME